jgi:hypothetical protein
VYGDQKLTSSLRELLEEETNQYKRKALESKLKIVENAKKLLTKSHTKPSE